jgi:2-polyprenyl-6-hydroxyphenyl methylase/3-demethylubiquinone-9 3-methyltransferase
MQEFLKEGKSGDRFEFGKNWEKFLTLLNEDRIHEAEKSLQKMLGIESLSGRTFLDIGCGSGLFSLAARRLGARVRSFDYDLVSVECAKELKRRLFPDDNDWTIERGDVLEENYLRSLGQFDIVYAWGVLHHTGSMWQALENVDQLVAKEGVLFISIYNDQGAASRVWTNLKKFYNRSSKPIRFLTVLGVGVYWELRSFVARLLQFKSPFPFKYWRERKKDRGMSAWHDFVDWVGGYPFEVAKPEQIFDFYYWRGFELMKLKTCAGGIGCNEYIFHRKSSVTNSRQMRG